MVVGELELRTVQVSAPRHGTKLPQDRHVTIPGPGPMKACHAWCFAVPEVIVGRDWNWAVIQLVIPTSAS
jgi:hypothetical protein